MFKKKKDLTSNSRRRTVSDAPFNTAKKNTASVFSYRASRSNVNDNLGRGQKKQPSAVASRRGRTWLKRTTRLAIVFIVVVLVVFNLWLEKKPAVVMLDAEGESRATYRSADVYQAAAEKAFADSILNTSKATVNKAAIEEALKREFPELSDVSVSVPVIGHRPTVYLEPSSSRLIVTTRTGRALVLDTSGKAIASGNLVGSLRKAGLPEVKDESTLDAKVGDAVLPSGAVVFITEVVRQLKAKEIEVASLTLPGAVNELHLRIKGVGYYVKFSTRGDARVETGRFLALKQYLESQQKSPAEYIDVRVENRAYFK